MAALHPTVDNPKGASTVAHRRQFWCPLAPVYSFVVAGLTGFVDPVLGFLGAYAVSLSIFLLPWGMTFAAGVMIYVISDEIIHPRRTGTASRMRRRSV